MKKKQTFSRQGFSLVELVVILAIFCLLMIIGSNFLIQTIQSSYNTTLQNDVRQSANTIMQNIIEEIRKAKTVRVDSGNLLIDETICYHVNLSAGGDLTKGGAACADTSPSITPGNVGVYVCENSSCSSMISGLAVDTSNSSEVVVTLTVQQRQHDPRSDFRAKVVLTSTATPRQY